MITVGITAYNAAATLPALLESLLTQQYSLDRAEIIVADNGSCDGTAAIVRGYAERGPVRLVEAGRRHGPAVGRNAVIGTAVGDMIAFTDADCIAHPRWLVEIEAGFASPKVGCVAGAILPTEPRTPTERCCARHRVLSQEVSLGHPFLPYAQTANAAFRREVFERVGCFDEGLITFEDGDLAWRMQLNTDYILCYRPQAIVWHKHRSGWLALLRQSTGWGIGQALVYKKYPGRIRREPIGKLLWDYRRIVSLAALSLRRLAAAKLGGSDPELLYDAFFSLLVCLGIRLGRWRGSLSARVFYP